MSLYGMPRRFALSRVGFYRKHEEAADLPAVSESDGTPSQWLRRIAVRAKVLGEVLAGSGATAMNEVLGKQTFMRTSHREFSRGYAESCASISASTTASC
ncbi:MAG: hypothetical protein ACLR76_02195 [Alistipes sp.]